MAELIRDAPASVLACYAHPDDPEVSCGGTLARWTAAGAEVHTVVCTSGDKGSSDPATDPAELVARRAEEVAAAASLVGLAGHHLLGHPDGELENGPSLRRELVALIRQVRPQIVVCPDPQAVLFGQDYYNHLDHRVVGWATLDAAAPAAALPLYFPETRPPRWRASGERAGRWGGGARGAAPAEDHIDLVHAVAVPVRPGEPQSGDALGTDVEDGAAPGAHQVMVADVDVGVVAGDARAG